MLRVALTGGIGSGKSSVAELFGRLGAPIIDADLIARELTRIGQPLLRKIARAFGAGVINADGSLNRRALGNLVFANPDQRRQLEQILHPPIRREMEQRLRACAAPYAILVIPLLLETRQQDIADIIIVVDLPEQLQIKRVMQRDGLSEDQVRGILAAQCQRTERLEAADYLIDNSGGLDQLIDQVENIHQRLIASSASD